MSILSKVVVIKKFKGILQEPEQSSDLGCHSCRHANRFSTLYPCRNSECILVSDLDHISSSSYKLVRKVPLSQELKHGLKFQVINRGQRL